jgi:hypothetical protein
MLSEIAQSCEIGIDEYLADDEPATWLEHLERAFRWHSFGPLEPERQMLRHRALRLSRCAQAVLKAQNDPQKAKQNQRLWWGGRDSNPADSGDKPPDS